MKTIAIIVAAAAVATAAGSASAQTARDPGAFESVVPFAGSDAVVTGRSAYVGNADTSRVYGDGPNRLAPHINGIF